MIRKLFLLLIIAALTESGMNAMPNVEHREMNSEPRVVGVDQAHWWVKVNRMAREGKPAQEIFDFINERSKQEQEKLLPNQKKLAGDILRGMVVVRRNEVISIEKTSGSQKN